MNSKLYGRALGIVVMVLLIAGSVVSAQTTLCSSDGTAVSDLLGYAVAPAGDIDNDGFADYIAGAPEYLDRQGRAILYSGQSCQQLWFNNGSSSHWNYGGSVSGAGDVNADGWLDFVVGAPGSTNTSGSASHGQALVVSGKFVVDGFGVQYLHVWNGVANSDHLGWSVAGLGDLDGDGYDDVVAGAPFADPMGSASGAVLVKSGATGLNIYPAIKGHAPNELFGWSLANAGDIDGDGVNDILVGAPGNGVGGTNAGAAYLYSGATGVQVPNWFLPGPTAQSQFGFSVCGGGDVNGDGAPDVAVGEPYFSQSFSNQGQVWVFSHATPQVIGNVVGTGAEHQLGFSVSIAGDTDGDGYDDVLAGAPGLTENLNQEGAARLFSGRTIGQSDEADRSSFGQSSLAFHGGAVGLMPDVNGDGLDEWIVGSVYEDGASGTDSGRVDMFAGAILPAGSTYCYGDGSGTACPCNNPGAAAHGCANGTYTVGAQLTASGTPSVSVDTLKLAAAWLTPSQPGLFFQGVNATNGGNGIVFGDGLRCAGGSVVRLQVRVANGSGSAQSSIGIGATGGVAAGDIRRYQWWYRDPALSPCGQMFNLSNGVELTWLP